MKKYYNTNKVTKQELDNFIKTMYEKDVVNVSEQMEKLAIKSRTNSNIGPQLLYELNKNKK